jgi:hypothetical protein
VSAASLATHGPQRTAAARRIHAARARCTQHTTTPCITITSWRPKPGLPKVRPPAHGASAPQPHAEHGGRLVASSANGPGVHATANAFAANVRHKPAPERLLAPLELLESARPSIGASPCTIRLEFSVPHWRFPFKLPKLGADISKRIVRTRRMLSCAGMQVG